jgi:amidohydrolase
MAQTLAATTVLALVAVALAAGPAIANRDTVHQRIDALVEQGYDQLVTIRRDLHQHPELSNREFRTASVVAGQLKELGFDEVRTEVAVTGVVGVLRGGRPGPVVALRADMDALPVTEATGLPFASTVRAEYNGQEVGVMHACGHDAHTAMLLGTASVLAKIRQEIPGTVVFLFQPAEEGPPAGEEGGADLMVRQGALENPQVEAIFGLHVWPGPTGQIGYRTGGIMASADILKITVEGSQTHGAMPWMGVDPVVVSAQIILALQTISSRQVEAMQPVVISIGSIHGGVRSNIIPQIVTMEGTIRTLDPQVRTEVLASIREIVTHTAQAAGAKAQVETTILAPVTFNDRELTRQMIPTLRRVVGEDNALEAPPTTAAEDFAVYQKNIPGLYFFLGINPPGLGWGEGVPNHSPLFDVYEPAMKTGVKALANLAYDYLNAAGE